MIGTISAGVGIVSGIAGMLEAEVKITLHRSALKHTKTHYLVGRRR